MPDVLLSARMSEHVVNLIVLEGLEQDPRILLGRKSHHQKKTREKVPKKKKKKNNQNSNLTFSGFKRAFEVGQDVRRKIHRERLWKKPREAIQQGSKLESWVFFFFFFFWNFLPEKICQKVRTAAAHLLLAELCLIIFSFNCVNDTNQSQQLLGDMHVVFMFCMHFAIECHIGSVMTCMFS